MTPLSHNNDDHRSPWAWFADFLWGLPQWLTWLRWLVPAVLRGERCHSCGSRRLNSYGIDHRLGHSRPLDWECKPCTWREIDA